VSSGLDWPVRRPVASYPLSFRGFERTSCSVNSFECVRSLVDADRSICLGTEARLATYLHLVQSHTNHALDTAKRLCNHGSLANATRIECVGLRWMHDGSHLCPVSFVAAAGVSRSVRTHAALHCHPVRIRRPQRSTRSRSDVMVCSTSRTPCTRVNRRPPCSIQGRG
jgi:hypothetical protein